MAATSADALFRTLRSPATTAQEHNERLEAAHQVLDSQAIPQKEQLIVEWILDRLLRAKDQQDGITPILNAKYWKTLENLLSQEGPKRHLVQTLSRIPVLPTLTTFLARFPSVTENADALLNTVAACYAVIMPAAKASATADALLACVEAYTSSYTKLVSKAGKAVIAKWHTLGDILMAAVKSLPTSDKTVPKKLASFFQDKLCTSFVQAYRACESGSSSRTHLVQLASLLVFSPSNLTRLYPSPLTSVSQASGNLQDLFAALTKTSKTSADGVLCILPALFEVFTASLKHISQELFAVKGASTSSRSAAETHTQVQYRYAVFGFVKSVVDLLGSVQGKHTEKATVLRDVVKHIQEHNLYISGPSEANQAWLRVLQSITSALQHSLSTSREAIDTLGLLIRLDYASVEKHMEALLSSLAYSSSDPAATSSAEASMSDAIEHNGKTRQLPNFVLAIEEALSKAIDGDNVASVMKGPLASINTRAALSKECEVSLNTSQISPLLAALLDNCKTYIKQGMEGSDGFQQAKKKRKISGKDGSSGHFETDVASAKLLATVQLITAVMKALSNAQTMKDEALAKAFPSALKEEIKQIIQTGSDIVSSNTMSAQEQKCAASILLLRQSIASILPELVDEEDTRSLRRLLGKHRDHEAFLTFQLILTLLHSSVSAKDPEVWDTILDILEESRSRQAVEWSGYSYDLSRDQLPVAVWHHVSTQSLQHLEHCGSEEQVNRLAKIILSSTSTSSSSPSTLTFASITYLLLHSASFFEHARIRTAISSSLTLSIDKKDSLLNVRALSLFPREYLDRNLRRNLVSWVSQNKPRDEEAISFLLHYTKYDAGTPLIQNLTYMRTLRDSESEADAPLREQLYRLLFRNWNALPERYAQISEVVPSEANASLLRILVEEGAKLEAMPDSAQKHLNQLYAKLIKSTEGPSNSMLSPQIIEAHNSIQIFSEWLGHKDAGLQKTALQLLSETLKPDAAQLSPETILSLIELLSRNITEHGFTFKAFVIACLALSSRSTAQVEFGRLVQKVSQRQSADAYEDAVTALVEGLSEAHMHSSLPVLQQLICSPPESSVKTAARAFSSALRYISVAITCDSPVLDLMAASAFLRRIAEQRVSILEVHDLSQIWSILAEICKPSALAKDQDQARAAIVTAQASQIFTDCIETTSIIAQHRRDLLVPTFPQFCAVISAFLSLLRLSGVISSNTKEKQLQANFPRWAIPGEQTWLKSNHAKAVSRLLVSLGTKTTTLQKSHKRNESSRSSNTGSAVSLAGPLSKHAPFIVFRYLKAAMDGSYPLSSETRKALSPGVMEILGSMGKFEREALMKGFMNNSMEAERALLKTLWKDYDRIRYKGD